MLTPTFAVDGHMTLIDPWRGKKSLSPDGGVKVSMTCGGEGMEGTYNINWAEGTFFEKGILDPSLVNVGSTKKVGNTF